jgi:hypothetical protein
VIRAIRVTGVIVVIRIIRVTGVVRQLATINK